MKKISLFFMLLVLYALNLYSQEIEGRSKPGKLYISRESTEKAIKKDVLKSDVDMNIPVSNQKRENVYALIIGNEDYESHQKGLIKDQNVDYASNDARIFREYVVKMLGVPEKQVNLIIDGTYGQLSESLEQLVTLAQIEKGDAEIILYYSGHGLPDEDTREAYIIPVDISGKNLRNCIKLNDIYKKLSDITTKKVTVILDACFSGGGRNQSLLSMKGVKIKPKDDVIKGNMVVFSSSSGEESSGVFNEKQHGIMTYFLLKKLKETSGDISYKNLLEYLIKNVQKESVLEGKLQTPRVLYSPEIEGKWEGWKMN